MIIDYINSDLLKEYQNNNTSIIHGCNCFHSFGAGIARSIKQYIPEAYEADKKTKYGDHFKLGDYSYYEFNGQYCINAYTQFRYNRYKIQVDYGAIFNVFYKLDKEQLIKPNEYYGIPKIGAGLAGGDWSVIENLINLATPNTNIKVFYI